MVSNMPISMTDTKREKTTKAVSIVKE